MKFLISDRVATTGLMFGIGSGSFLTGTLVSLMDSSVVVTATWFLICSRASLVTFEKLFLIELGCCVTGKNAS